MAKTTKAELENRVAELEAMLAAAGTNAATSSKASTTNNSDAELSVVARKGVRAKVNNVFVSTNFGKVTFELNTKVTVYAAERDETGRYVEGSSVEPRSTNYISVDMYHIRANAVKLGIAKLMLVDFGALSREVCSAFIGSWINFNIEPFSAGDEFKTRNGEIIPHEHDGQDITLNSATINPDDFEMAYRMIILKRK